MLAAKWNGAKTCSGPREWKSANRPVFMRVLGRGSFTRVLRVARVKKWSDLVKFFRHIGNEGIRELRLLVSRHGLFSAGFLILNLLPPWIPRRITLRICGWGLFVRPLWPNSVAVEI